MSSFQKKLEKAPSPQLAVPPVPQLILFALFVGWLVIAPVIVGLVTTSLPPTWPELPTLLLATFLLAILLLVPTAGLTGLAYWHKWTGFKPFALAMLMTVLYLVVATAIRAASEPGSNLEMLLRLTVLTIAALIIGGVGLRRAGVPDWLLSHAFGFDRPPPAGVLTAFTLIALLTIGWPLSGSLGDNWNSQMILLRALATSLPEEIFFRGAVLGLITFNFQHRKGLAAFTALLLYVTFTPSLIVPYNDWSKLVLLVSAIPFALLMTELRALTGSLWPGILLACAYRATPLLFTDSRDELALITQPWQTAAHFWMVVGAGVLAVLLWLGRGFLTPRWQFSGRWTTAIALSVALFVGGAWTGLWLRAGYPGFHNDGFLIIMAEQADLSGAEAIADPLERRAFVRNRLIETAEHTQAPIREALEVAGLSYRPFYLINMIRVEGHHRRMAAFAGLPGVAQVMLNPNVRPYPSESLNLGYGDTPDEGQDVGRNISQVQADKVWQMGITGQGIVVGGQDTGYDWKHPALSNAYRGNVNGTVNHAYNWHDAWSDTPAPFDDDQHGTHTMGTILGDDGHGNQIGMAPGAQWIGCRNMQRGLGNPASYTDCMEFFLAPYPPGGDPFAEGDVSLAPHIINNSWGCPDIEGCNDTVLEPAVDALRAAGIMMVVSAGNEGPGCRTVSEPPARYDNVFSVGATDNLGRITGFSSRGPVPRAGTTQISPLLKPDIAAPGANVRSSIPGGGYGLADGTSMAGPHVAGLVALIWSAKPSLIGRLDETEAIIRQSATPTEVSTSCTIEHQPPQELSLLEQIEALENPHTCACGDVNGHPNNVYGWGEINALAAIKLALEQE
jgi:subtilisin family serine protease